MVPCVLFEDEHVLVVNKPAGMNTHAPSPFAGEGIYDWLRHREPRWSNLAIVHRLDKETSGVMVFGKTPLANRSLTEQFTKRVVRKKYILLTDRAPRRSEFIAKSKIVRAGERYASSPHGEPAETQFQTIAPPARPTPQSAVRSPHWIAASPLTGRTHQIRVHAAENGFPIVGDTLYGGSPFARVCLHAEELVFRHPADGGEKKFFAPADFEADTRVALRLALVDSEATDVFRIVHGASDGWPGWHVDRLGNFVLSQSEKPLNDRNQTELARLAEVFGSRAVYHKTLTRQVRRASASEASPQLVRGETSPERFTIRENDLQFELSFAEGYSVGLFLDQRDNRRRLQTGYVAPNFSLPTSPFELLNAFAYTCAFSVGAAKAGARTTSLDLSKKYLEWGRRNFALNGIDPAEHDFIYGDAFDWMRRLAKRGRAFDVILLDPPTFSQSKERGVFRVEKDYGELVAAALPLLKPGGVLFCSTNAATWAPEKFLAEIEKPIHAAKRKAEQQHYAPQPPDFPVTRSEPAYLKTVWMRIS